MIDRTTALNNYILVAESLGLGTMRTAARLCAMMCMAAAGPTGNWEPSGQFWQAVPEWEWPKIQSDLSDLVDTD